MGNSETSNILNMKNDNGEATMTIQLEIPKEFVLTIEIDLKSSSEEYSETLNELVYFVEDMNAKLLK